MTPLAELLGTLPFPRGVGQYLVGGLLVGLGVAVIYLATGIIAGASSVLESSLSYVSDLPRFERPRFRRSRGWRLVFTVGIVSGGAAYALAAGTGGFTTGVPAWRLLAGGVLVGVGTRLGEGCTSGHGVCGLGSLSRTSIASVATFLAVAAVTAGLVATVGVAP